MKAHTIQLNPAITFEDFGEEIILVNLQNGAYFSLKGTAPAVWRVIVGDATSSNPVAALSEQFSLDDQALAALRQLLFQFRQDELAYFPDLFLEQIPLTAPPVQNGKPVFSAPVYEKFTNMQDILLLDPIHDVGELGWPYRK